VRKVTLVVILLFISLCTTGCWDQLLLKDVEIMALVGFDNSDNNLMEITTVPFLLKEKDREKPKTEIYSAKAETVSLGFAKINAETSKLFTSSKIRIIILGEDFVKTPFRQQFDTLIRDPSSAVDASVVVVKGKAKDFIRQAAKKNPDIGNALTEHIKSQHESGIFLNVFLQHVIQRLTDPGESTILPNIAYQNGHPVVIGTAMLHLNTVTGHLNRLQSAVLMLSSEPKANGANITLPIVHKKMESRLEKSKSFLSFRIRGKRVKFKYHINPLFPSQIQVDVYSKVVASLREYTPGELNSDEKLAKVEKIVTDELNKRSKVVYQKMQQANCDFFGIGRHLIAYYPEIWRKINWNKTYPTIKIVPHIKVELNNTGVIY
jgi:Ger(x)C family germination protein